MIASRALLDRLGCAGGAASRGAVSAPARRTRARTPRPAPAAQAGRDGGAPSSSRPPAPPPPPPLSSLARRAAAAALAAAVAASCALPLAPWPAPPAAAAAAETAASPPAEGAAREYEALLRRKGLASAAAPAPGASGGGAGAAAGASPASRLPSEAEAGSLMAFDRELYTDDGFEGMVRLQRYASYLRELEAAGVEAAPGCEACTANRLLLEQAWQTVAAEFFDASGRFSQAWWAEQLLDELSSRGGRIRGRPEAYAALKDLVDRLGDRYSAFLTPPEFRRALRRPLPLERSYLAAQFVGIGVQLGPVSPGGGRLVEAPLSESPAEAAGIVRGDRILEIEGIPAEQLTLDQTTALLRGPSGSPVSLTLAPRGPDAAARALTLERRALPQPPVLDARLPLGDGRAVEYLRLHYFDSASTAALRRAVAEGEADGVAGFVIDLRNNAGGVFEEAVASAALFLPPPADIAETVRAGSPQVIDSVFRAGELSPEVFPEAAAAPGPLTNRPLAVIVNASSASASEVLAGALRDNRRAVLIGERTFGKGVVQYFFPLSDDGAGLRLTVSKYLTPARYDISLQGGLPPDIACRDYPRGVFTLGRADLCTTTALDYVSAASRDGGGGGGGAGRPAAPRGGPWRPLLAGRGAPGDGG